MGTRQNQEKLGGIRRNQKEPRETRGNREKLGGTRRNQEKPRETKGNHENHQEPEFTKINQI